MKNKKDTGIVTWFLRISLRWKINFVGIFIIVMFTLIVFIMILPILEQGKLEERRGKLKAVVNSTVSIMEYYEKKLRSEGWKIDSAMPKDIPAAKKRVIKELRHMRYDKTEYFFILDGDGKMIMHPLKPEFEGQNMLDERFQMRGKAVFRDLVINSQRDNETFVSYLWESKYSKTVFEPQTTYARHFWQWDWVICSGVYTQDIIDTVREVTIKSLIYISIGTAVAMFFLFFVGGAISKREDGFRRRIMEARDNLWGEMQLAKKIQTILLPDKPEMKGYEIAVFMEPADDVGGDYYDIVNVANKDWIVIGDVSGHGVPAGLIMMMVQTAINVTLDSRPDVAPSELLNSINTTISRNIKKLGEDKYMTLTVLAVMEEGKMSFSGLHQDIMLYRKKSLDVELIETNGMWIGIMDDIKGLVKDDNLTMEIGDVCLLYTDGITESWIPGSSRSKGITKDNLFGDDRLVRIFKESGDKSVIEIKNRMLSELEGYESADDITFVVLKRLS